MRPLASCLSLSVAIRSASVSMIWNFRDELPQLRTNTFMMTSWKGVE